MYKVDLPQTYEGSDDFPYCCSADVWVSLGAITPKRIKELDATICKSHKLQSDPYNYDPTGNLTIVTVTRLTAESLEVFHELGWQDYVTWKSIHGDYPVTMLGKIWAPFVEKELKVKGLV